MKVYQLIVRESPDKPAKVTWFDEERGKTVKAEYKALKEKHIDAELVAHHVVVRKGEFVRWLNEHFTTE